MANLILKKYRMTFLTGGRILNRDFTIISDNCLAGSIYKDFNLPFNSPTIGLFFYGSDYIKFCSNLNHYLELDLEEAASSKWVDDFNYPVGKLGDIELHFLHYDNFDIAKEKWVSRITRVNFDNIYFTMTDRDLVSYDDMVLFDSLPYKNKVLFSSKLHSDIKSLVWCQKYSNQDAVGVIVLFAEYLEYFDLVGWINGK
ncbi:hypothetical protein HR45_13750 [Shewanella mangrovi]|uniref:DUF1919 domain-containing protein n=2 Tax=Shewanella mangrovi TaxID=1515746 RepID=A0A094LP17_9GAMM|nr:hypothetical protein HR45_13750 [Shewanella mangrovi]